MHMLNSLLHVIVVSIIFMIKSKHLATANNAFPAQSPPRIPPKINKS